LSLQQNSLGYWTSHGLINEKSTYAFDVAQIIDGLCEFKSEYNVQINLATEWLIKNIDVARYIHPDFKDHPQARILFCERKTPIPLG
jgi:hypothetical protein